MLILAQNSTTSEIKAKICGNKTGPSKLTKYFVSTYRMNNIRIMVFGDSNSFLPGPDQKSWPRILEDKDPHSVCVINESCSGRTTRYDIGEYNGLKVIAEKIDVHRPIDYVVVMLGTNDVKNKYGPPGVGEIVEGIHLILNLIQNEGRGAVPILLSPPPLGNVTSGELAGAQLRIPAVAAEYRRMAMHHNIRLIDIHSILEITTDFEPDVVHLNALGRKKVADCVWDGLLEKNSLRSTCS